MIKNWREELKKIFNSEKYAKAFYTKRYSDRRFNDSCIDLIAYILEHGKKGNKRINVRSFNLYWKPTHSFLISIWDIEPLEIESINHEMELEAEVFRLRKFFFKHLVFVPDDIERDKMPMQELRYIVKYSYLNDLLRQMTKDGFVTFNKQRQYSPTDIVKRMTLLQDGKLFWNVHFIIKKYPEYCKNLELSQATMKVVMFMKRISNEI